jgi:branched-chain amino acid aminotransferase
MKIYIDGTFYPEAEAKVSVFDHGLLYGDGVFEGIRFYNDRVFKLPEHIERLYDSAKAICLTIPLTPEQMTAALLETARQNGLHDGYVRLIVTRGVGNLGLSPDRCKTPTVIIVAATIALYPPELYQKGLDVVTCATRRIAPAALPPTIKSLNYLNNILAKIEANQAGAGEGLMLNEQGYVAECTGDNIFIIKHGEIFTPPISAGGLRGITREVVFDLAAGLGVKISEPNLTRHDIYTANECFLTGTAAEIIPAVRLDGRPIGDGKPGALTAKLIAKFHELTQTGGTPIYG